jgi:shikimate dehydrogenase
LVPNKIDVLINTVPVTGRGVPEVISGITTETICVDITYAPAVSEWLSFYKVEGCRTANGLGMLAHQAALQFKFWWNIDIDGDVLLEVIQ